MYKRQVDACRPVIVVGDPIPTRSSVGDVHTIRIHVVSDRRDALRDGVVTATVGHADGTTSVSTWGGVVDPDSVADIASLTIPALVPGPLTVQLEFDATGDDGEVTAINHLHTTVS